MGLPLVPGAVVTFWHRKPGSNRSSRIWCRVLSVDGDTAEVILPPGWDFPTRTLPVSRFTVHREYGVVEEKC